MAASEIVSTPALTPQEIAATTTRSTAPVKVSYLAAPPGTPGERQEYEYASLEELIEDEQYQYKPKSKAFYEPFVERIPYWLTNLYNITTRGMLFLANMAGPTLGAAGVAAHSARAVVASGLIQGSLGAVEKAGMDHNKHIGKGYERLLMTSTILAPGFLFLGLAAVNPIFFGVAAAHVLVTGGMAVLGMGTWRPAYEKSGLASGNLRTY